MVGTLTPFVHRTFLVAVALVVATSGFVWEGQGRQAKAAEHWFEDVDIGLLSVGARATYFNPRDGDSNWFGGAQVRLHPFKYFAIEGSADYRETDIGSTTVRTFPVQGSALIYPFGTKRISPFILGGGGWYFTNVEGPGNYDDTQQRFGAHVGGGVQIFITNHFSIDSTYRHIWLEKVQSRDASLQDKKFQDNGHMVTIGLNYHF